MYIVMGLHFYLYIFLGFVAGIGVGVGTEGVGNLFSSCCLQIFL